MASLDLSEIGMRGWYWWSVPRQSLRAITMVCPTLRNEALPSGLLAVPVSC